MLAFQVWSSSVPLWKWPNHHHCSLFNLACIKFATNLESSKGKKNHTVNVCFVSHDWICVLQIISFLFVVLHFSCLSSDSSDKEKPVQSTEFSSTAEMPDYVVWVTLIHHSVTLFTFRVLILKQAVDNRHKLKNQDTGNAAINTDTLSPGFIS